MQKGTVIFFNMKSKFGFIKEDETGNDYYFYIKNPIETYEKDDRVNFEITAGKKGKSQAINVKKITKGTSD